MVEPARSKSISWQTRSSRGCKGTHSSNPCQGTSPREGGAVACGLVCLSTCRPIWVHNNKIMRNFSPVSEMRRGQRSWGRFLAPSSRNKANMAKHKNCNFPAYQYDNASDSLLTDRVLTIYTNHPGGNLAHKHKTIKGDVVEERPDTKYFQIIWTE